MIYSLRNLLFPVIEKNNLVDVIFVYQVRLIYKHMTSSKYAIGISILLIPFLTVGQNEVYKSTHSKLDSKDAVFQVEAIYSGSDCDGKLVSFKLLNGFHPITWHELNDKNEVVQSVKNQSIESLKDQTTYIVEDAHLFTDTIFVQHNRSTQLNRFYPNPTSNILYLDISSSTEEKIEIRFIDLNGKVISSTQFELHQGIEPLRLDLSYLQKGIYLIHLESRCINVTKKIFYRGL